MMRLFLTKIIRQALLVLDRLRNQKDIIIYKIKYPGVNISSNNYLAEGCSIRCDDGSKLFLNNCRIGKGAIINAAHGGKLTIKDSFIGAYCIIVAVNKITIKSNCQIAEMVVVRDHNHKYGIKNKTIEEQGFTSSPIIIEENVWIGAKVTVTQGCTIGENTIVGANAVVKGILEMNSVYVGVPARKIKSF